MGWKRYSSMLTDKISATMFKTNKAKFGLMELGAKEMRAGNAKAYAEKLDLAVTFWQQIINYIQRENCNLIFRNAACYAWGHDMVSMTYAAFLEIAKIQKEKGELPSLEQLSTMPTVNMFPLQHIYNPKVTSTQVRQNFETHYKEEKVDKVYQKAHEDVMRLINAARRERAIAGGARKHQDWGLANVSRSASSFMKKSVASTRTMSPKINYNGDNAKEVRRFDDESIRTQSIPQDTQWESHPNVSSSPPAKIVSVWCRNWYWRECLHTTHSRGCRKFKLKKGDM